MIKITYKSITGISEGFLDTSIFYAGFDSMDNDAKVMDISFRRWIKIINSDLYIFPEALVSVQFL